MLKKYFKIDPLKSFVELPILWIVVGILFFIAVILAVIILYNSRLTFSLDYSGVNSIAEIFKIPLAILAIIVTYAAFLATIHRSVQTKEQIIITSKQNTFSNYYKHIDEFEKYISATFNKDTLIISTPRLTHKYLFPKSINGDYSVNREFIILLDTEYSNIINKLETFNNVENQTLDDILFSVYNSFSILLTELDIKIIHPNCRAYVKGSNHISVPDFNIRGFLHVIKTNTRIIMQLLAFDHNIVFPDSFMKASIINYESVPYCSLDTPYRLKSFDVFLIKSKA